VRVYNTELRTFPGVIWASTFYKSNKPMQEFTVAEDLKQPPQIKF
jgi:LemA protein